MATPDLKIIHVQFPVFECHLGGGDTAQEGSEEIKERERTRTHTLIFARWFSFQEPQLIIINLIRGDSESS